jgi:hypothetical protein
MRVQKMLGLGGNDGGSRAYWSLEGDRRGAQPVRDHQIIGESVPERYRLRFDQAPHVQPAETAVLVMGVKALD